MLLPNMPFVAITALRWIVSFEKTILEINQPFSRRPDHADRDGQTSVTYL